MSARAAVLASLLILPAACGGASAPAADQQKIGKELDTLRRQVDDDRRVISDLDNRVFVLEDKLATAEVQRQKTPDAVASLPPAADAPIPPPPRAAREADDGTVTIVDLDTLGGSPSPSGAHQPTPIIPRSAARRAPSVIVPRPASGGSAPVYDDKGLPTLDSVNERLPVVPLPPIGSSPPPRLVSGAMDDYKAALDALHRREHAAAITGFRAFLARYPNHDYADNAQYWLGETYYDEADYQTALVEFRAVIKRYPDGNKAPDALLKVGFCYLKLGDLVAARDVLGQVIQIYPRSGAAQIATKRLGELHAQGG